MNNYEAYKKTDIPWLGEIPSHWETKRNKNLFIGKKEIIGKLYTSTDLLSLTTKGIKIKNLFSSGGKKPTTYETYQAVEKDELVLCLFDLDCSAVFSDVSQYNGMISPAYNVFKIKNQHEKYFKYLFDYIFQDRTYKIYSKSIRYTITEENFNNLETPVPPISEQIQIANYLDWKINEIDKLILIEKEQIKELENLKQKYIDEIYQNIKTKNFISLSKIGTFFKGGGFSRENLSDSDYGAILYGDIYTKYNYFFEECISKIDENAYFNSKCIDGNVVLFTGSGETKEDIGKSVAYVGTKKIALGGDIIALKPNKNFFSKFIAYFSNTSNIKAFKHMESTGDIIVHITLGAIKAIKIPFISVEEQKDIVKKIDEYILNLKNLIALIEDKIKYFLSLKQSLIAEVVTGKIDVRNIAIPQYEKVETTFETDNIDELEVQDYGD
ncbi:restriction endonuclease subunit S [Fusobacterium vincentii]|jgi:Restriction endonuclease S subunits|uniref:restriction endonuclease subunit S n=1 Tax=Fusobacterium vincentii TaxID=155615 RepID=UPI000C1BC9BA|nr:restriction endonuclease subunit S [Fusobacterium vincentii]ATV05553.1 restriction endonuclease subunit S [Fusobacterium vincentii]